MRLGGFVIHGSDVSRLSDCLAGLCAACDEVLVVDTSSTRASLALPGGPKVRRLEVPWEGYGAARAAAAEALRRCDYLFFLDSDEGLLPPAVAWLQEWKRSEPTREAYTLRIRDWAELPARRFVFREERHVRLVRADRARWHPRMIVHECLPRAGAEPAPAAIEHCFATSLDAREEKNERYARLWALRAYAEGLRSRKSPALQRLWHFLRGAVLQRALLRGGWPAVQLAWSVSRYHARKYDLLTDFERGAHPEAVAAFRAGRWGEAIRDLEVTAAR